MIIAVEDDMQKLEDTLNVSGHKAVKLSENCHNVDAVIRYGGGRTRNDTSVNSFENYEHADSVDGAVDIDTADNVTGGVPNDFAYDRYNHGYRNGGAAPIKFNAWNKDEAAIAAFVSSMARKRLP